LSYAPTRKPILTPSPDCVNQSAALTPTLYYFYTLVTEWDCVPEKKALKKALRSAGQKDHIF